MKQLIINADDFGYNRQITDGIVESHLNGVVTSTTAMANMPGIEYAATCVHAVPKLSIGVHLTLTQGKPLSASEQVATLVKPDGCFYTFRELLGRMLKGKVRREHVEQELSAQIQHLVDLGIRPTHWDSHHHSATIPFVFGSAIRVAKRFGIPAMRIYKVYNFGQTMPLREQLRRLPNRCYYALMFWRAKKLHGFCGPDQLVAPSRLAGYDAQGDLQSFWHEAMSRVPEGISEFAVHPGRLHEDEQDHLQMRLKRVRELEILTSSSFREAIERHGIALISYHDLLA